MANFSEGLLGNPLFMMGLAGLGNSRNPAQGWMTGLLANNQYQQQGQNAEYRNLQMEQLRAQMAQAQAQQAAKAKAIASLPEGVRPYAQAGLPASYYKQATSPNGEQPKDVQSALWYLKATPEQRAAYDKTRRAQQWLNLGNQYANPNTNQTLQVGVKPENTPEFKANVVAAQEQAKNTVEKQVNQSKAERGFDATTAKTDMLGNLIDQAKEQAGFWTTGFAGSGLADIAGTPAHDLSKTLETIRANIGFDKLQEMRDSSPTGGALGQVSERENSLLQAVWGDLSQSQSKEQFVQNLERVKRQVQDSWSRVARAYEQDYGKPMPGYAKSEEKEKAPSIDDLLKKYGG